MRDSPQPTFREDILWDAVRFKRWATYQDCTLNHTNIPDNHYSLVGQHLTDKLNEKSGRILFRVRADKWLHTRDFWAPIGTIDYILTRYQGTPVV